MVEVGPRDGLQNESVLFTTSQKLEFIGRVIDAGARRIEAASFVNPKLVPQMADAEAVAAGLPRREGVTFIGLVLNKRGALRALEAGMDELGAVCAASDGFAIRNQGMTSDASLAMCCEVVRLAREHGRPAQITISTAFGCPFDGEVDPSRVVDMARLAAAAGPVEIAIADTIGVASPGKCRSWSRAWRPRSGHCRCVCTFTTRATPDSPMCGRRCKPAPQSSTHRWEGSAAVRLRRAPRAMFPPRMWRTCWNDPAIKRVWISTV
jgi:isopropylmalate/homocitrate/citramalate synthase